MNAFAKVLVVFIFLLSVGFALSQMVLYSKRVQYRDLYNQERDKAARTADELTQAKATLEEEKKLYDQSLADLQGKLSDLEQRVENQQLQIKDLGVKNSALLDDVRASKAAEIALTEFIAAKEKTIEELEATKKQLSQTLNEKVATINELDRTLRERDEKIAELTEGLAKLQAEYASLEEDRDLYARMVSRIAATGIRLPAEDVKIVDGKVIKVDPEYGLVIIDKGKDDGVKVNYPFTVYRPMDAHEADFIAKVVVYEVYDKVCLARPEKGMVAEGKQVLVGDDCTTRLVGAALTF